MKFPVLKGAVIFMLASLIIMQLGSAVLLPKILRNATRALEFLSILVSSTNYVSVSPVSFLVRRLAAYFSWKAEARVQEVV